jgi:hypothetical protein
MGEIDVVEDTQIAPGRVLAEGARVASATDRQDQVFLPAV